MDDSESQFTYGHWYNNQLLHDEKKASTRPSRTQLLNDRHCLIKLGPLFLRRERNPEPSSHPRPVEVDKGTCIRRVHDADVPTVQILCAGVLRREIAQEILQSRDGLGVIRYLELLFLGGAKIGGTMGTELGGDGEDVALGGAGDVVAGVGRGRGEAAFDAC